MSKLYHTGICILAVTMVAGCSTAGKTTPDTLKSATYTSAFPTRDVSAPLAEIQRSVVRITATATYTTYYFEDSLITKSELEGNDIGSLASRSYSESNSNAGTAITIAANSGWGMLITNHHVVDYPDTLYRYADSTHAENAPYLEAVAVKSGQRNFIFSSSGITPFEVVSTNPEHDLALLEVDLGSPGPVQLEPLKAKAGNSDRLQLASVLYIMGYPRGVPVVTRAIVSSPNRNKEHSFLTDALFNEGISGGIILASRTAYHSFEWVGMANSSFAKAEYLLVPDPEKQYDYNRLELYEGDLFVTIKKRISYGVTKAIPMPVVMAFLDKNRPLFNRRKLKIVVAK